MIKFANKDLPSYVKVLKQKYSILPPVTSKTDKVYGRMGVYDFGIEVGERILEFDIMLIADNEHDVIKKARLFSSWLFYEDLQPLVLLDEPDKQYMARFIEESDVDELYRTGSATIKFLVPSGLAESVTPKTVLATPTDSTPIQVTNNGTAKAYPVFNLTMKANESAVAVVSDEQYVLVGESASTDKSKATVNPVVLNDNMGSLTGWTTASAVDDGVIAGSLSTNGTYFSQASGNYGTGTRWHGGALIRSLSREVQDFEVRANIRFDSSSYKQLGRIEIYLLDANNVVVGMVGMRDPSSLKDVPYFQARAGTHASGYYFVNSYGTRQGVFENFSGIIQISRVGRKWKAYVAKVDAKGNHNTRLIREWYDTKNTFSTKKVAKVQVHIGGFGTSTPVSTMYVTDLKVTELTTVNTATNVPEIFKAGDVVTIDNERAIVLLNGEPIYSELDPASQFFALESGVNGIIVTPPESVDVSIQYKERWL